MVALALARVAGIQTSHGHSVAHSALREEGLLSPLQVLKVVVGVAEYDRKMADSDNWMAEPCSSPQMCQGWTRLMSYLRCCLATSCFLVRIFRILPQEPPSPSDSPASNLATSGRETGSRSCRCANRAGSRSRDCCTSFCFCPNRQSVD